MQYSLSEHYEEKNVRKRSWTVASNVWSAEVSAGSVRPADLIR